MRIPPSRWLLVLALAAAACGRDLTEATEDEMASVAGAWTGRSPMLDLNFTLTDGPAGTVFGTGTVKLKRSPETLPITVTGTYQRPLLSLTIDGIRIDQQVLDGTWRGSYTAAGPILEALQLTPAVEGMGDTREVTILLEETGGA